MVVDPTEIYAKEQEIFQHFPPCWNYGTRTNSISSPSCVNAFK